MYLGLASATRGIFPTRTTSPLLPRSPTRQQLSSISSGLAGIAQTLAYMRSNVRASKINPVIRELALRLTRGLPQKDYYGEAKLLHDFVQNNIRYVRDIADTEVIQTPEKTLEYMAGDCDDKAQLLAALLESIGHETQFDAVGFQPGKISHVLLSDLINGQWIPLETTEPVPMGWRPPGVREILHG